VKRQIPFVGLIVLCFTLSVKTEAGQCPQVTVAQCFGTPQQLAQCQQANQKILDAAAKRCEAEQARLGKQQTYHPAGEQNTDTQQQRTKDSYWYHGVSHAEPFFYEPTDPSSQAVAKAQCERARHTACVPAHGSAGPAL